MTPVELLARLAVQIRSDIAPMVTDEYARTQAHMAAVILDRVSRELASGPATAEAERADVTALIVTLTPRLADAPVEVADALEVLTASLAVTDLGPLITALYRWGQPQPAVLDALAEIRPVLRRDIDRRMAVAR